ncbi:hypothetical protein KAFR_0F03390 [Kazachstania africana CBS 2517]|uniref:PUM-HD domain-containing protein n=1 Tax=Kazachstania africana (strain ATCC 22294 / BCRC 22015 / CBS 2517 / CECT 1963 / NBRC 1671 / NRRL Y-8276) TaxID=1071382 RepID=H2AX35_KAZAF|nr:hypothetical protein KAFR_0F03390 [Kazachstania africana CBS 2517]CCF58935.1 hypothetical protein KAFR_0F03390 [Kazachstania africana CBS 2517]
MTSEPLKDGDTKSSSVDPVVTQTINAALEQLNLDAIDNPIIDAAAEKKEEGNANSRTEVFASNIPPPHMVGMSFVPYSQMMPMPHQPGFFPPPEFQDSVTDSRNHIMFNGSNSSVGIVHSPNFMSDPRNMNPYNNHMLSKDPLWPGSGNMGDSFQIFPDNSAILEDNMPNDGSGGAALAFRRQTFHAISTNDLIPNKAQDENSSTEPKGSVGSKSNKLGSVSNVGSKTRTQSTSIQGSDRDALFLQPPSAKAKDSNSNGDNEDESSKLKDMNNLNTYSAAYPYGGPLLHPNPIMTEAGAHSGNPPFGMPSPFLGRFEYGSPFHSFSPVLGGPNPALHPKSPISHIPPSPIQLGPGHDMMPNVGPIPDKDGNLVRNGEEMAGIPMGPPQHFAAMMQQGGSPPPWLYGTPPFNGMIPSPQHPHPPINSPHRKNQRGQGSRGNHFGTRGNKFGRNGGNHSYFYNNTVRERNMEGNSRYIDATLDQFIGNIYSLCKDQHGCRFLQKQLDVLGKYAADAIFEETKDHTIELMTDSFGNYLIQKLIERVTTEQRIEIAKIASPEFVDIALNSHGTRALQKLIECISTAEEANIIIEALKPAVVRLSMDLNGNHVVQKCLEKLEPKDFQFIFDLAIGDCIDIATHRHGCCVLQRCLDHGTKEQTTSLCDQLLTNLDKLTLDPFGNYVVQYILTKEAEKQDYEYTYKIVNLLKPKLAELSLHKFGSNVIEKLLKTNVVSESIIAELVKEDGKSDIESLLNDSYGNYVLQTALDISHEKNEYLYGTLSALVTPLLVGPIRNTPHGKRIISMLNLEQ